MSYSQTVNPFTTDRERLRRSLKPIAAAVFVISSALNVYGAHDFREVAVVTVVIVATMAGVYGFLLPRKLAQESAGGTALTLSLIGLAVLVPAFWSGLPLILGAAGALLGYAGKNATSGSGKSTAGFVIGLLAVFGYLAVYVLDTLHQFGIG